jgi:protein arginine kinase activator
MKCQVCGKDEATVHFKEVKNDQVREFHLCETCAVEKGFHSVIQGEKLSLASQFQWMAENVGPGGGGGPGQVICPECNLRYSQFLQTGRLGCPACYEAFQPQLRSILRRVHGATRHMGKAPGGVEGERMERRRLLQSLHDELAAAIQREEFEKAAQIRDRIRALEKEVEEES